MKDKRFGLPPTYAETKQHEAVRRWKVKGKTPASIISARKIRSGTQKVAGSMTNQLDDFRKRDAADDAVKQLWEDGKITSKEMWKRLDEKKK